MRQGVRGGFRPAFQVQAGSLVGDAVWAILGLAGIGMAMQFDALRWPLGLAGAAYLAWLSWDSWQAARVEHTMDNAGAATAGQGALKKGMALSLTNPQNIAYWAAMGGAMGTVGVAHPGAADYAVFFAGFMVASVVWCFVCAAVVRPRIPPPGRALGPLHLPPLRGGPAGPGPGRAARTLLPGGRR